MPLHKCDIALALECSRDICIDISMYISLTCQLIIDIYTDISAYISLRHFINPSEVFAGKMKLLCSVYGHHKLNIDYEFQF